MKNSNLFERIMQISNYKGFNSLNDFAKNGLKYKSSEKLNRLKDSNNKPSIDIIIDISNSFEDVDLNWLINGIGSMLIEKTKSKEKFTVSIGEKNGEVNGEKPKVKKSSPNKEVEAGVPIFYKDTSLGGEDYTGIPLIPIDAMAGFGEGDIQVMDYETSMYKVPEFEELKTDFMIRVKGSSMYPKYSSGDTVACKKLNIKDIFFQWNKVYVLSTEQGAIIKRVKKGSDNEHILLVSENPNYEPFELHLSQIYAIAIVIGVIRLE